MQTWINSKDILVLLSTHLHYRVRQLIQSDHIFLNTEAKKIQRTFLTLWGHPLVSKGSDQAQKFWSSLNAASISGQNSALGRTLIEVKLLINSREFHIDSMPAGSLSRVL